MDDPSAYSCFSNNEFRVRSNQHRGRLIDYFKRTTWYKATMAIQDIIQFFQSHRQCIYWYNDLNN